MLKLYNTLSQKKENFKPIKNSEVGMYTCGPTVYWFAHVGNFRSYVFADVLRRVLKYNGYKVKHIINVTDVGHLVRDSDDGVDKVEEAAKREGKTAKEVTKFYFDSFHKDFLKLNLKDPSKWVWATEHIAEQIELIKSLEKKGFTYRTGDGIYFDTSKFSDYGKLSRKKIGGLTGGKRGDLGEKKNKTDFALWKFSGGEVRQQEWESPWGRGFPGWHIECSAMSTKYLGKYFDIHTGGTDHIPIHHENEIAQSVCGFGVKHWVNFWMHGEFLVIPSGKMSKSSGNIKTVGELEGEGISPLAFKYFTYTAHYRKPLTFSSDAISGAEASYRRLKNIILGLKDDGKTNSKYLNEFEKRINDDLDMPGAVAVLWNLLRDEKAKGKVGVIKKMDEVFGLRLFDGEKVEVPKEIEELAKERYKARENKDWKKSDELREKILKNGWKVVDKGDNFLLDKV